MKYLKVSFKVNEKDLSTIFQVVQGTAEVIGVEVIEDSGYTEQEVKRRKRINPRPINRSGDSCMEVVLKIMERQAALGRELVPVEDIRNEIVKVGYSANSTATTLSQLKRADRIIDNGWHGDIHMYSLPKAKRY